MPSTSPSKNVARALRRTMTIWEKSVWRGVRNHRLGFHFRRQHRLLGYVLDFYCDEARVCVEIDGDGHKTFHRERDRLRDSELEDAGILVLRFYNEEIGVDLPECLSRIKTACEKRAMEFETARPDE
ncbi:MAG TPA: DUF559 domain-containing protein [Fimbriimonas sp.]|nr:DUF559 domain-containing protein [Fimbriimonas sp.]